MATEAAPRRRRFIDTETVIDRGTKPGRPVADVVQTQKNGQVVRRLVALELGLDRQLRQVIARDGLTYRSAIEAAVRGYLAREAS